MEGNQNDLPAADDRDSFGGGDIPLMVPRPPCSLRNEWVTGPSPPSLVVTITSTSYPLVCPG